VIKSAPILGHGPGSFSVFFAQETQIPPGFATSHAHNILLQIMAETGFIGVVFVVAIITAAIIYLIRTWRAASPDVKFRMAAYSGAGIAALSHHLLDYLFESPLYALSLFILFALTLRESPILKKLSVRNTISLFAPVTILLVIVLGLTYSLTGASDYWNGIEAGRDGDWQTAADEICRANSKQPRITLYGFQCSISHAQLYDLTKDPKHLQDALQVQRDAIAIDPYWPIHWANLSVLEWESGEKENAVAHMMMALNRGPKNTTIALNLALMEEALGRDEVAVGLYLQALELDPWLQFRQLYSESGLASKALEQFELDQTIFSDWELLIAAQTANRKGEFLKALDKFKQALAANPLESRAIAGIAQSELHLGQINDARRDIQIALFIGGSNPEFPIIAGEIALEQDRNSEAQDFFNQAHNQIMNIQYSSAYYYRSYYRYFLSSDLVPQITLANFPYGFVDGSYDFE
jgi:tetratricopeptide (TPR) repeat protein